MTPHAPGRDREEAYPGRLADAPIKHCSCGAAGLAATALGVVVLYPLLVAVAGQFHLLSSTWLVLITVVVWLSAWMVLELAWEWRERYQQTG